MRYRLSDIPALFATPAGRIQLKGGIAYRLWPLLAPLARLYRRTAVRNTRVIAVVGSFGKSTTTRAVAAALRVPSHDRMLFNAFAQVAFALLRIRRSQRHAVIEVGIAAPGEMADYARAVRPDVTVVTAIGSEHHRSLGTLEATRAEKARMIRILPPTGVAVLNGDDPNVMWMTGQTQARAITFGFGAGCDVRATNLRLDWPDGSRFRVAAFGEERDVTVQLIGRHMIYPVLAAIAVSHLEGFGLDETLSELRSLPPTAGRMQPIALPNGATVLRDDYKSSLETMHAALDVLAEIPARRRIVLFGDVSEPRGSQSAIYQELGRRVAGIAAHLIVVGHSLQSYGAGARKAGMSRAALHDGGRGPHQAAAILQPLLAPGDVVLIKGRHTEKLDRVRLRLQGERVLCGINFCSLRTVQCDACPMLRRGWGAHRVIMQGAGDTPDPANARRPRGRAA